MNPTARIVILVPLIVVAAVAALFSDAAPASPTDPSPTWITDGQVNSVAISGSTAYVGGSYDRIGPYTGGSVLTDPATGNRRTPWPDVAGTVVAAAPDGAGGWFLGGFFESVGGVERKNLAHVLADGTVDPAWIPPSLDADVSALAVRDGTVYVGGGFEKVGGEPQRGLVALDAATGARNPALQGVDRRVYTLATGGSAADPVLYVGGNFSKAAGATRESLAAYSLTTLQLTGFDPNVNGTVYDLEPAPQGVYFAGTFNKVGTATRLAAALVDGSTGAVAAWDPRIDEASRNTTTIDVAGGTVYIGGGGGRVNRNLPTEALRRGAAAFDATTAVVTPWAPAFNGTVVDLEVVGSTVYAAGEFTTVNDRPRVAAAAVSTTDASVRAWDAKVPAASVADIETDGASVVVAGSFATANTVARQSLAAIDLNSGEPTAFDARIGGAVEALAVGPDGIWAGGTFNTIGGVQAGTDIVELDPLTGERSEFAQDTDGRVTTLLVDGADVYAGGTFTKVGTSPRGRAAAFRAVPGTGGALLPWNPDASGHVRALARSGDRVFLGGDFTSLAGAAVPRRHLAAVEAGGTGAPLDWKPEPNAKVHSLAVTGGNVVAGGDFTAVNGTTLRRGVAMIDAATGIATEWNAGLDGAAQAVATDGTSVYAGGVFSHAGFDSRTHLAELGADGRALPWAPHVVPTFSPQPIRAIAVRPNEWLVVGGQFVLDRGPVRTAQIAAFKLPAPAAPPVPAGPGGAPEPGPGGGAPGGAGGGANGGGGPGGSADRRAPVIARLGASRKRFRVGRPPRRGTTFTVALDEPASLTLDVLRATTGRRTSKGCMRPMPSNRRRRPCKLLVRSGTILRHLPAGASKVQWTGKIGKRSLPRGEYTLRATARDVAGNTSTTRTLKLRIVR